MHDHRGTLRLLLKLVAVFLLGAASYILLVYAMSQATSTVPKPILPSAVPPVATNTTSITTSTTTTSVGTTTPDWEKGMQVLTQSSNNTVVHLALNERFVIQLGSSLKWSFVFDPSTAITRVANFTTADGIQGIYEADKVGTTTLRATGAPICTPHQACPNFLQLTTITFVVK